MPTSNQKKKAKAKAKKAATVQKDDYSGHTTTTAVVTEEVSVQDDDSETVEIAATLTETEETAVRGVHEEFEAASLGIHVAEDRSYESEVILERREDDISDSTATTSISHYMLAAARRASLSTRVDEVPEPQTPAEDPKAIKGGPADVDVDIEDTKRVIGDIFSELCAFSETQHETKQQLNNVVQSDRMKDEKISVLEKIILARQDNITRLEAENERLVESLRVLRVEVAAKDLAISRL